MLGHSHVCACRPSWSQIQLTEEPDTDREEQSVAPSVLGSDIVQCY